MMASAEYRGEDATELARLVAIGEVHPSELVDRAISEIHRLDPQIGAMASSRFESARRESREVRAGVFAGVPILLKDLGADVVGETSTGGFAQMRDIAATHTSYVAESLEVAGFIRLGRTAVPELASSPTTENTGRPPVRNPWALEHSAGGSSGGSAAAVASGMVAIAHGSDGGGSIRIPASACGLVGLKATRGRVSAGPQAGEGWAGASVEGVLTRSVRDTARSLAAMATYRVGEPYYPPPLRIGLDTALTTAPGRLRIGFTTDVFDYGAPPHPDVIAETRRVAQLLETLGHDVEATRPCALFDSDFEGNFDTIVAAEAVASLASLTKTLDRKIDPEELEPRNAALWERGQRVTIAGYLASRQWLQVWSRRMAPWWDTHDLLLTPTVAMPPPRLGWFSEAGPDAEKRRIEDYHPYSGQFNITGQPAISLPLGRSSAGLPIGMQFAAAYGRDDLVIQLAAQLEAAFPWNAAIPRSL